MTDKEMIVAAAEKVLGWRVFTSGRGSTVAWEGPDEIEHILATTHPWESVGWSPLSSDADAFMLVDALAAQGWLVSVRQMPSGVPFLLGDDGGSEYGGSERPVPVLKRGACLLEWHGEGFRHSHFAFDDNRRRAIVLAALKAVGASE